ncbi:MAG: threonine synthase [Zetaproteobacteria bacterium CG06_land_8_20_14_3_00_59_53]|nr:MAG: threonine synthase [Zetaproteobacteria bacterium CG2_30_59_37]PIO90830.1 MAG: threonine synthase [Zetaproteobacteria bacterium CG23_combo_of_CG06-09_8_20_14_all_59_86]PIQ64695.1 MAG: threonine synthase [Zetaproteobacteria bacterium CG11_big_fil_rev_8_21_14_0_20_59_439]PIU71139.1 MAG: threonine synthase [Zetaproteobacteria bacterium CG06_land_8_20_14_3_00_59_53]PIU96633.1 MAG: threonine synthase [Zetaproteobacteria bacterium CG03_land_8_20_14_0_80_59_51]PIY46237.1 MAG: threonine synthas
MPRYEGIINRYRAFLPIAKDDAVITLYEGDTPLHESMNLRNAINPELNIYLKFEGLNPTGSFKDRGMTMAVTQAYNAGSRKVICASTGNTSASAAAYAANCGMEAFVLIPDGKIALGKLSQGMRYGAKVIQIRGNFDDALELVRTISADGSISLVNSVNPYRIQGQKTASFEIVDELGFAPDYHALPVGNAGNITAYWMGYKEYFDKRISKSKPKMLGFQAAGSAPIVLGHPIDNPETIATAIRIGKPASWKQAEAARDESGGVIDAVTDEEILEAYNMLACMEGVFCEPASAASVAGIIKLNKAGYFQPGASIVCTLTGNGLKDPDTAMQNVPKPVTIDANEDAVRRALDS